MCRFCRFFVREEKVWQKSKPIAVTKSFKILFRPTLYTQHFEGQHSAKWVEYQLLSTTENDKFFTGATSVVNKLHYHFAGAGAQLFLDIDVPIFDTIIRKFLLDPDAEYETIERALSVFVPMRPSDGETVTHYRTLIKNLKLFKLVIGQVSLGS